jgi:hypothetical protein
VIKANLYKRAALPLCRCVFVVPNVRYPRYALKNAHANSRRDLFQLTSSSLDHASGGPGSGNGGRGKQ